MAALEEAPEIPLWLSVTIIDKSGRTLSGQTVEAFWISVAHAGRCSSASTARSARPRCGRSSRSSRGSRRPGRCYPNAGLPNAFGEYDEKPADTCRYLGAVRARRLGQHRRRLLRDDAGAHPRDRRGGRGRAAAARAGADAGDALQRPRAARDPPRLELHHDRRAHERHRLEAVRRLDQGGRLRAGRRGRARSGARRREHPRRQHGRGDARRRAGDDDVPQPHRHRARDRAPADHGRQLEVDRHRGGAQVPPGQGHRQLDQPQGGRGARSSRRRAPSAATAPASSSWRSTSRARPTRSSARSSICPRAYRLLVERPASRRGHRLRPEHPRRRDGHRGARRASPSVHRGDAAHQGALPRRASRAAASRTSPSRSAATTPCARRCTRRSSTTRSAPASTWASSTPASSPSTRTSSRTLLEHVEDVLFNRRPDATERLVEFAETVHGGGKQRERDLAWREAPVEQRLSHALVHGIVDFIEADAEEARSAIGAPARRHRRPADGRHEGRRRPLRRREDVPAPGRQERARDEARRRVPRAVHGGGEGRGRRRARRRARSCSRPSRATSTTSARTSSASSSAATTTRSSTSASWCPATRSSRPRSRRAPTSSASPA